MLGYHLNSSADHPRFPTFNHAPNPISARIRLRFMTDTRPQLGILGGAPGLLRPPRGRRGSFHAAAAVMSLKVCPRHSIAVLVLGYPEKRPGFENQPIRERSFVHPGCPRANDLVRVIERHHLVASGTNRSVRDLLAVRS